MLLLSNYFDVKCLLVKPYVTAHLHVMKNQANGHTNMKQPENPGNRKLPYMLNTSGIG